MVQAIPYLVKYRHYWLKLHCSYFLAFSLEHIQMTNSLHSTRWLKEPNAYYFDLLSKYVIEAQPNGTCHSNTFYFFISIIEPRHLSSIMFFKAYFAYLSIKATQQHPRRFFIDDIISGAMVAVFCSAVFFGLEF